MKQGIVLLALLFISCMPNHEASYQTPLFPEETGFPIAHIDPDTEGAEYPGRRGPDQLVIYTPRYGRSRTGTNPWGYEAVIEHDRLVRFNLHDSPIPAHGFVASGHGKAARWIRRNLHPGAVVNIRDRTLFVSYPVGSVITAAQNMIETAQARLDRAEPEDVPVGDIKATLADAWVLVEQAQEAGKDLYARNLALKGYEMANKAKHMTRKSAKRELRGAWVRLDQSNPVQIRDLVGKIKTAHFNVIFPETIFEGYTLHQTPDDLIPQHPMYRGWDPLKVLIDEAHKEGIQVHAWCHVFFVGFDSPLITQHEDWLARDRKGNAKSNLEKDYYFFCPANKEVREFLNNNFKWLVAHYDLDGFQFDYIRYPQSRPQTQEYCFCENCRSQFEALYGRKLREITAKEHPAIWAEWSMRRRQDITSFLMKSINDIRSIKPDILISADVFPDPEEALNHVYQPWLKWAERGEVDFYCPMAYTDKEDAFESRLQDLKEVVAPETPLAVGLGQFLYQDVDILSNQIEGVRQAGLLGSIVFALNHLTDADYELLGIGVFRQPAVFVVE